MANTIQCATHGESRQTFVCNHLSEGGVGLGFHQSEPKNADEFFPDAWCDDCELVRAAHDGWNPQSEKPTKIVVLCSGCYERSRIRNTSPSVSLDDLADLRWKCADCEEWHSGPCLDFSYDTPYYWTDKFEEAGRRGSLSPQWKRHASDTFLNEDYCAIENRDFFVRGRSNCR